MRGNTVTEGKRTPVATWPGGYRAFKKPDEATARQDRAMTRAELLVELTQQRDYVEALKAGLDDAQTRITQALQCYASMLESDLEDRTDAEDQKGMTPA